MNLANKITVVRIILIPVFLAVLLLPIFDHDNTTRIVATAIFIIASLTDALDGYIARSRNMITTIGKFMDPLADKLLVASALIAMVQLGDLSAIVVIIIICREFTITSFRIIAASENIIIAASIWGKIKTNFQVVMIIYILLGLQYINTTTKIIGDILIILTVALTIISAVEYIYKNAAVLKNA